jgi:Domain of unknown function (DUF4124)
VTVAALPAIVAAQSAEIFVCVDENGQKSFQNTGNVKGCKRMDVQPILTVPAPRQPAARTGADRPSVSPASFPRIDRETQQVRDSDRRRILEDELRAEEDRLAKLRAEYNNGEPERRGDERNFALYRERVQRLHEDIGRSENNINSLRRELALLRTQ